jgi:putative molybdopterin biosynthesis protein
VSLGGGRPDPERARALWLDSLARAGWVTEPVTEQIPVADALGRVTTEPVLARWPSPRSACSAMDGIATRAATVRAAADGAVEAGEASGADVLKGGGEVGGVGGVWLAAGTFEWIDTGDPMPDGADTVLIREWLVPRADGGVEITSQDAARVTPGRHVRAAGEDFAAGEVLVPAGRRLRPGDLAAAAAGGHVSVAVARPPVVAIIPTGDEIRPLGSALGRGDFLDTNSLMLAARCRQLGAVPLVTGVVPDDPDALAAELRRVAGQADLLIVIAGSSRGRDDHAGTVIGQVGEVAVAGLAVRPGHPGLLGHAKRPDSVGHRGHPPGVVPVIGLPGYPLAAAVVFELFAAPLLSAQARREPAQDRMRARLSRDWSSPAGLEEWVLVTLAPADGHDLPRATPARHGAGSVSQLARADAWWPVPAGKSDFAAGATIEVRPLA